MLTKLYTPAPIRWVGQQHHSGCQIAVAAMLLGLRYEEVADQYPVMTRYGYTHHCLDLILTQYGIGISRLFRYNALTTKPEEPWPPSPWRQVHWAEVVTSFGGHCVVMLHDGSVLDPASDEDRKLDDYLEVHHVTALHYPQEATND